MPPAMSSSAAAATRMRAARWVTDGVRVVMGPSASMAPQRPTVRHADAVGRSRGRCATAGQGVEDEAAPGLHRAPHGRRVLGAGEGSRQLVGLPDRDRSTLRVRDEHDADMDGADRGRVVVEEPDWHELRLEVRDHLLVPLASEPALHVAVAGVQVAADADRPQVVQARVAAGLRAPHQEPPLSVAQHEVRDHLLVRRVLLGIAAAEEESVSADSLEGVLESIRPDAEPSVPGDDRFPGDDEHLLVRAAHYASPARRRARAAAKRSWSAGSCGPCLASRRARPSAMTRWRSRSRVASTWAFLAAIPAPIVASPLASRVIESQPPAASASAHGQSARGRSPLPATASTRAAETTSGMWLTAATYESCDRASSRNVFAPQARASASTLETAASSVRPGTRTHGRSRNRVASAARNPVVSRPAMGCPPTNRSPCAVAWWTIATLVEATSVITASGSRNGATGPASSSSSARHSVGGAASTTRSAPSTAASSVPAARSSTPAAAASRGPAPRGVHAATVHAPAGSCFSARAIEPPTSPSPRNATRITRLSRPAARPSRARLGADLTRLPG